MKSIQSYFQDTSLLNIFKKTYIQESLRIPSLVLEESFRVSWESVFCESLKSLSWVRSKAWHLDLVFTNTEKTFKIPVFWGSMMYLVRFGFVIMPLGRIWENLICIKSFFTYLVKIVFGTSTSLVFVAIQKGLFGLKLIGTTHFSAFCSYYRHLHSLET